MNITASKMVEGNPNGGIAGFLQMIQTMSAGQSAQAGADMTNLAATGAEGNPFSQILLQQLALLLQSSGVELSEGATKEELVTAFKNLLEGDPSQTDSGMSELAMLAFAGRQIPAITGNDFQGVQDAISTVAGEAGAAGSANAKAYLPGGQLTSFLVQAIRDYLKDTGAEGDEKSPVQTGSMKGADVSSKTLQEEVSRQAIGAQNAGENFSEEIKNLLQNKNAEVGQNDLAHLKDAATLKTDPSPDKIQIPSGEKPASFAEAVKSVTSDPLNDKMKNPTAMPDGRPVGENSFVESRIGQVGANIKTIMPEAKVKAAGSEENADQGDALKIAGVTETGAQDGKKKISSEEDMLHKNIRMDADAVRDSKTATAGKDLRQNPTVTTESQSLGDKFKTELKSKTAGIDNNAENNHLNAAALSSGVTQKTEKEGLDSSSIINRVAAEFRENAMSEGGRVKVTLTPPSLGSLELDVSVQNNKVRVMLIAENKDVQRILSGNLETLKTTLQTQGLTIERCDVMMQDSRDEYPQGFNGQQAFGHDSADRERSSRPDTQDEKSLNAPSVRHVQEPVRRPQYAGSESISLFA